MDTSTGMVMTDEMREELKRMNDPQLREFKPSMRIQERYLSKAAQAELAAKGMTRVSKNAKCPCGSGKRFKNCHKS